MSANVSAEYRPETESEPDSAPPTPIEMVDLYPIAGLISLASYLLLG